MVFILSSERQASNKLLVFGYRYATVEIKRKRKRNEKVKMR